MRRFASEERRRYFVFEERRRFVTEAEGESLCSKQEGDSLSPKEEGDSLSPKVVGDSLCPKEGDSLSPKEEGDSLSPKEEGDSLSPKEEGDSLFPNEEGDSSCPKEEGDSLCLRRSDMPFCVDYSFCIMLTLSLFNPDLGLADILQQDRKPFGPLMCMEFCRRFPGLPSCLFSEVHLKCTVTETSMQNTSLIGETPLPLHLEQSQFSNSSCSKLSTLIQSRRNGARCVQATGEAPKDQLARLLVFPQGSNQKRFVHQFLLHNNSLVRYSHIEDINTQAVAYMPQARLILLATSANCSIASYHLDDSQRSLIKTGVCATCMAADEDADYVFVVFSMGLSRMKRDGQQYKILTRQKEPYKTASHITVNTKSQRIFYVTLFETDLISASYDDTDRRILHSVGNLRGMFLNTIEQALYYVNGKHLIKLELSGNTTTKLMTLRSRPSTFTMHGVGFAYYAVNMPYSVHVVDIIKKTDSRSNSFLGDFCMTYLFCDVS